MKLRLFTFFFLCLAFATTAVAGDGPCQKAKLGIYSTSISIEKARVLGLTNPNGVMIKQIIPDSAADEAGLQVFDYIIRINNKDLKPHRGLTDILNAFEPGDEVTVHFVRNGKKRKQKVILSSAAMLIKKQCNATETPFLGVGHKNTIEGGGVVVSVANNSTAEDLGIEDGDVIKTINGHSIYDWDDLSIAINDAKVGESIKVEYEQNGAKKVATAIVKSKAYTKANSEYAFLGIHSNEISSEKAKALGFDNKYGEYVTFIVKGSAAEKYGIQPFDYIYGVDEYRTGRDQNLVRILRKFDPDDKANVRVIRNGKRQEIPVVFGRRSDKIHVEKGDCQEPFLGVKHVQPRYDLPGVEVNIVSQSSASAMGLKNGDIITKINGYPMIDWHDIGTAIDNMTVGKTIEVNFARGGKRQRVSGPIKSKCDNADHSGFDFNFSEMEKEIEMAVEEAREEVEEARIRAAEAREKVERLAMENRGRNYDRDSELEDMEVKMKDISQDEANAMRQTYGVEMPLVNDLTIQQLAVSPNPSRGMFQLSFELPGKDDTSVRVYNSLGRIIYEYELSNFTGRFDDMLDISQNGTGAYFLEVRQGSRSITKKLIVQRN